MNTTVRAYDLGGFGDVAGAMRVASYLQKIGLDARILPASDSVQKKLKILKPDVETTTDRSTSNIQVDVAGHYRDDRNKGARDVPHHFTEDMDNWGQRRIHVPLYMKSGLERKTDELPRGLTTKGNPMFYRPYREWEIPVGVDVRELLMQTQEKTIAQKILKRFKKNEFEKHISGIDNIAFAHTAITNPNELLLHPYFSLTINAGKHFDQTFGIGLFVTSEYEARICEVIEEFNKIDKQIKVGVVRSDGTTSGIQKSNIIFLGPQDQVTTTSLFVNSDFPNLVTGDLSLSDGMYASIAMNGQGFFYQTAPWKIPSQNQMLRMLSEVNQTATGIYHYISNTLVDPESKKVLRIPDAIVSEGMKVIADPETRNKYKEIMNVAIRREIMKRYGYSVEINDGDLRIAPGAPFLIQDATAKVVETLREDPDTLKEVEGARDLIQNGAKVQVNVTTGVLEPETTNIGNSGFSHPYSIDKIFNEKFEYKTSIDDLLIIKESKIKKNNYLNDYGLAGIESIIKKYDKPDIYSSSLTSFI